MADFNLEAMSLKELRQLQKDLAKAVSTYEDRHKADVRAKLEAIAEMGYSLADLIGVEVKTTRAPAVAKYRRPENAAATWSGRGRKPQWFVEALAAGWQVRRQYGGLTDLSEPPGRSIVKLRKPVSADMTA